MNQSFSERFAQMRENALTGGEPQDSSIGSISGDTKYPTAGNTRNLCFVWPDGKRMFINYAYLVSGQYSPAEGSIVLVFTTHTITLKGTTLEPLFEDLMGQVTRQVVCMDQRYSETFDDGQVIVSEIVVS
jgi:hypothetical protein